MSPPTGITNTESHAGQDLATHRARIAELSMGVWSGAGRWRA
jgi:hypothetical protein